MAGSDAVGKMDGQKGGQDVFHTPHGVPGAQHYVHNTEGTWSTCHVPVPVSVRDNKKLIGSVDLSDALLKYYSMRRKTVKWYKALLFHLIDVALVNGFLLHKELAAQKSADPSLTSASGNC